MTRLLLIFTAFLFSSSLAAQELRCNIQLSSQQVQGTNRQVFQTLQGAINEFLNARAWTNYKFTTNERIECSMLFNIQDYSGTDFKGTLQVQSRRPIFNSSYNSNLFNYLDQNIEFTYVNNTNRHEIYRCNQFIIIKQYKNVYIVITYQQNDYLI